MQPLREDDPVTLGPFTLRARLGAGGMGVVYLAETADGVQVAVKTVPRGVGADVRIRLQREAQLLAKIDHPRIARFVAADADADEPWLAMRYVPGPSLADAELPLPAQQLRQLADGLAEALAALHALGVTHRDVKPGNVIMTTHGAVLVDLGIAVTAEASSMTLVGTAVGSPAWMAPEQFAGDTAGPPADVWGWAAVLTYAATGHEPFGSGTIAALAHRIMTQPADVHGVPDWLRGAVLAAFVKRPERRPTAHDLTRGGRVRVAPPPIRTPSAPRFQPVPRYQSGPGVASGPQPVPPPHPSGPQPVPRAGHRAPRTRRPGLIWAGVAATIAVAAGIVLVLVLTLSGGSATPGGSGSPTASGGTSVGPGDVTVAMLRQDGVCSSACTITGRVAFTHPKWGPSTLVTTQASANGTTLGQANVAVIDSTGASKWNYVVGSVDTFAPVKNPIDSTGHIFMTYNPGRYDGIVVVGTADVSAGGMTDFGTVPTIGTDASDGRFYDATLKEVSGRYEIVTEHNSCAPSCATGTVSHTVYVWNGIDDYVAQ